jgi:hypothetical protein
LKETPNWRMTKSRFGFQVGVDIVGVIEVPAHGARRVLRHRRRDTVQRVIRKTLSARRVQGVRRLSNVAVVGRARILTVSEIHEIVRMARLVVGLALMLFAAPQAGLLSK